MGIRNKILIFIFAFVLLFDSVSAECNETQIDINTANLTELDKITGIGPAYAQRITDSRPFYSLDDLIIVSGIGNKTLEKIKAENLACVTEEMENSKPIPEEPLSNEINETPEETEEESETQETSSSVSKTISINTTSSPKSTTRAITLEPIALNIKSENNKEILKKNLALAGVVTFCFGFGALFFLRTLRRKTENEFR